MTADLNVSCNQRYPEAGRDRVAQRTYLMLQREVATSTRIGQG